MTNDPGQMLPEEVDSTPSSLDTICDQFEEAWRSSPRPPLDEFLSRLPSDGDQSSRRRLLIELVMIDQERRWQSTFSDTVASKSAEEKTADSAPDLPPCPLLGDYVVRYPDLGQLDQLPTEVIAAEYRVRHRCGDRPDHDEYVSTYGDRDGALNKILSQIDRELRRETPDP